MSLINSASDIVWIRKSVSAALQTVSKTISVIQRDAKGNTVYEDDGETPKTKTVNISYDVPNGSETMEASFLTWELANTIKATGGNGNLSPSFWITETNVGNLADPGDGRWTKWVGRTEVSYSVSISRSAECGGYTVSVTKSISAKED